MRQAIINADMKGKSPVAVVLVTCLLATFLAQSVCAYENTQYGFSITPPEGWTLEDDTATDGWSEVTRFTKESTFQTTQPFTISYPEWRIRWQYETGVSDEHPSLHVYVYPQETPSSWFESITKSGNEETNGTLCIHDRKGSFYLVIVSATPNYTIVIEQKAPYPSVVFSDPSNNTGAKITVLVNQSGLQQDDPFLASHTHRYLEQYLYETYPGYLITQRGARVVGSLNGYQVKFNASVGGREMRFDSVIFLLTNQTFYIVCGALSPGYGNLSSVFKESINSFRLAPFSQSDTNSTPQSNATFVLIGVGVVLVVVSLFFFLRRKTKPEAPYRRD